MTLEGDPVSWLLLERGWRVVDQDGTDVGKLAEVIGDKNIDIFDGLAVSTGLLGKPRYVPAENVGTIVEGTLQVDLTKEQIDTLPEYKGTPPTEQILPD